MLDYYFLEARKMPEKSRRFLRALFESVKATGGRCGIGNRYRPCRALVTYGLGGADRYTVGMEHTAKGLPLLSFDLGYWDRKLPHRKYRFSLNGLHPTQVMQGRNPGPERFCASGLKVRDIQINERGPILLVGNAPKSIAIGAKNWTGHKSREIKEAFPNAKILYRPKPGRPLEPGVFHHQLSTGDIDTELRRVSLVVCRHSNVAVDACRHGVPVVCDDGAAACIYPALLAQRHNQPGPQTRREFLHRLAWWQWGAHETQLFWQWFFATFPAHDYRQLS